MIENRLSNNENKEGDIVFKGKTDAIYKVIVIGDPAVGKTSLLSKFATNQFEEKYLPTVGVSILKEPIELREEDATVTLMFWDIAGQPQFYMLHRPYFNGADGMLLVFDTTRSSTFSNVNNWYSSAVKYGLSGIPRILIGNKIDLIDDGELTSNPDMPTSDSNVEKFAKENSKINNINNVKFFAKKAANIHPEEFSANIIIVDPPRAGLSKKARYTINKINADSVIYVSCNPSTWARDIKDFIKNNYKLEKLSFINMFPATDHIELISLFVKGK